MTYSTSGPASSRLRVIGFVLAVIIAGLAVFAPAQGEAKKRKQSDPFKVMTRNVYLGADLSPALLAPTLAEAVDGAGEIYNEIERTNFPERAVPLAREIRKKKPELVGLQEVALWREQTPSDGGSPGTTGFGTDATDVKYDFLAELMKRLGKKYRVIGVQEEFEGELPADIDGDDSTGSIFGADLDARLTMRDVIVARKGGKVRERKSSVKMDHFENLFTADVGGVEVEAKRGWLSVEARVKANRAHGKGKAGAAKRGRRNIRFRFINTHLEAFGDPAIREAQAKELIAKGGPARTRKQVVLGADLNSGLRRPHKIFGDDQLAFKALKRFGFKDYGAVQSCCFPSELDDPSFTLDHTVDHVLAKPRARSLNSGITGDKPSQMTPSGLWPSDHGGVWSKLKLFR